MKFKTLVLFISFIATLNSCIFTEEIYVHKDGSGNFSLKMDMGELMKGLPKNNDKDSLQHSKVIDSIIFFKDILVEHKDSISQLSKEKQEAVEALKDLKLEMHVNEDKGEMLLDFRLDFKDPSELKNMQEKIALAQSFNDKKNKDKEVPSKTTVDYLFNGRTFKRKVVLKDLSEEELKKVDKSLQQASTFLEGSTYRLIYHFDKKIKKVSLKDAVISKDKKTMTFEVSMDSLTKNPQLLDFEVRLK
ncbi:MAG TPA: hypothetical protein ENK46_04855 [Flavobacteriia bacterium]|nr:hypothetical protein [Flavobacteriia bacterium]